MSDLKSFVFFLFFLILLKAGLSTNTKAALIRFKETRKSVENCYADFKGFFIERFL